MQMRPLLGLLLVASAAFATPITGTGDVSCCLYQVFLDGEAFSWAYSAPGGPPNYNVCTDWATNGCDLSYRFTTAIGPDISLFASNGKTSVSNPQAPPGSRWEGQLTWTAEPIHFSSAPSPGVVYLPVILSGYVKAWTAEGTPFFDYSIFGSGSLHSTIAYADASLIAFRSADLTFSGDATEVPEPATWILVGLFAACACTVKSSHGLTCRQNE